MKEGALRVARVLHRTTAEDPGLRTAVSFQGCSIRCKGCINPHLFSAHGGTDTPVTNIVDQAVSAGDEGLTLIGGEPFDQPAAEHPSPPQRRRKAWGVIAFSGHEYESLRGRDEPTEAFLASIDLLVDGPYQAWNPEKQRALAGSGNQRFIHISDRYQTYRPEFSANRMEVRIRPDGSIEVAGFLDATSLWTLAESTGTSRTLRRT